MQRCSLLSSRLTALMSYVILNEWLYRFIARLENKIHRSGVLTALFDSYIAGTTEISAVSVHVMCTPYNHNPSLHRVNVCLFVTCHLHLWQNDRDLLRASAVTRGGGVGGVGVGGGGGGGRVPK